MLGYPLPMSQPESDSHAADAPSSTVTKDPLRRSRASGAWLAVVALAALLLLLVVFIAQNTQKVAVSFFGWEGEAPLAVSLLIAAVVGILLAVVAGAARILQLRHRVRRHSR